MAASETRGRTSPSLRERAATVAGRNGPGSTAAIIAGLALIAAGGSLLWRRRRDAAAGNRGSAEPARQGRPARHPRTGEQPATVIAARQLSRAAGVLAFSALADSGIEHYRGSFANPAMLAPPLISAATLAVSAHGTADARVITHRVRHGTSVAAAVTGFAGLGFHLYNITKRPGGLSWLNLFYGAPPAAPAAVALAGLLGYGAECVRDAGVETRAAIFGFPAGRSLAAITSAGLLATVGEVGLLHFRGAYHNPAMYLPVVLPPAAAVLLANAAVGRKDVNRRFTRWALRATALLGFAGVGFHAYGVSRNMGGWRNWSQNILNGPPLPAPPSFTGLALAGLAALGLMDDHPDA